MTIKKLNNGAVNIAATSLLDFVHDILVVSKRGYVLDLSTESGVPQGIGYLYTVTMFPADDAPVEVDDTYKVSVSVFKEVEDALDKVLGLTEDKPTLNDVFKPAKAGRPTKNK